MFVSGVKDIPSALLAGYQVHEGNGRVRTDAPCENQYREVGLPEVISGPSPKHVIAPGRLAIRKLFTWDRKTGYPEN
jgi:hypothetical protein